VSQIGVKLASQLIFATCYLAVILTCRFQRAIA
jgi:hypothetical protein